MKKRLICGMWPMLLVLLLNVTQTQAYYSPTSGRWLNRDPIAEKGGDNLYAFVANDPVSAFDILGRHKGDPWPSDVPKWFLEVIHQLKRDLDVGPDGNVSAAEIRRTYREMAAEYGGDRKQMLKAFGNKRNRPGRGGIRGSVDVRLMTAGAATSAAAIAVTYFSAKMALADVRYQMAQGFMGDPGSAESHLFDFVRHSDSGDTMWAELDALAYVIEAGHTGTSALVTWSAITEDIGASGGDN